MVMDPGYPGSAIVTCLDTAYCTSATFWHSILSLAGLVANGSQLVGVFNQGDMAFGGPHKDVM